MLLRLHESDNRRVRPVEPESRWYLGLDLGKIRDRSVLAGVLWTKRGTGEWEMRGDKVSIEKPVERQSLLYLNVVPLLTSYTDIARMVRNVAVAEPFNGEADLVVDARGVGDVALDNLRDLGLDPIAVLASGGDEQHQHGSYRYSVPRHVLLGDLIARSDNGSFQAAPDLPHREEFVREMETLRRKITAAGRVAYEHPSDGHDDILSAVALASWRAGQPRGVRRMLKIAGF